MTTVNPKLNRVRGLLAKAERTDNTHEAEAFRAKAMELIAQYGIDEAELAMSQPDLNIIGDARIEVHNPFAMEKVSLYAGIGYVLGVRSVMRKEWKSGKPYRANRSDRQVYMLHCFGTRGDLERVEMLYTSLLVQQALELGRTAVPAHLNPQEQAAYRRSWMSGYAAVIHSRLSKIEQEAEAAKPTVTDAATGETKSTALVLASKAELAENRLNEEYPDLRKGTKRSLSGGGWGAGAEAGRRADLGGSRLDGARKQIS